LESYIERMYSETKEFVQSHPLERNELTDAGVNDEEVEPGTFD